MARVFPAPPACEHWLGMLLFAHTGHILTTIAYFIPVAGFLGWLIVTQIRERRRGPGGQS